jgi:hypothetical protein
MSGKNQFLLHIIWTEGPSLSIHVNVTDSAAWFTKPASPCERRGIFHAGNLADKILREDSQSAKGSAAMALP